MKMTRKHMQEEKGETKSGMKKMPAKKGKGKY